MIPSKPPATSREKEMFKAVKKGDTTRVQELLADDAALVRATDQDNSTPLHHAAWKGHVEVVAALLDAGADVDAQNSNGHWGGTPLHAASHGNQRAVAELLVARGADLHASSCNGRTPLEETGIHNAAAVANLLKKHGATR